MSRSGAMPASPDWPQPMSTTRLSAGSTPRSSSRRRARARFDNESARSARGPCALAKVVIVRGADDVADLAPDGAQRALPTLPARPPQQIQAGGGLPAADGTRPLGPVGPRGRHGLVRSEALDPAALADRHRVECAHAATTPRISAAF